MELRSVNSSFAKVFPVVYQDIQKSISDWRSSFLKVSRPGIYLGNERILVITTFGHKLILDTTDLNSLKPLLSQSPSDLVLSALFSTLHTMHSSYVYVEPSHSFHPINITFLMKRCENSLRVVSSSKEKLFDVAKNLYLNDLDDKLTCIESSYWKAIQAPLKPVPLSVLDPYSSLIKQEAEASKDRILGGSFAAFEKSLAKSSEMFLEELVGDDFIDLRAVVIERASFAQVQDNDLENMFLLNPSCYWLVYLNAEDPLGQEAVFAKIAKAKAVGYGIWQLPDFRVFDIEKKTLPVFGKWILLATSYLV